MGFIPSDPSVLWFLINGRDLSDSLPGGSCDLNRDSGYPKPSKWPHIVFDVLNEIFPRGRHRATVILVILEGGGTDYPLR